MNAEDGAVKLQDEMKAAILQAQGSVFPCSDKIAALALPIIQQCVDDALELAAQKLEAYSEPNLYHVAEAPGDMAAGLYDRECGSANAYGYAADKVREMKHER